MGSNRSPRTALVYQGTPVHPTITVENYCKWYELFIVHPSGDVTTLGYDELPDTSWNAAAYSDHVPNPSSVLLYADINDMEVCSQSLEMMVGRWVMEYEGREI